MLDILVQLTNKSFDLIVMQKNISYKIEYQIIEKDINNFLININLKYPKP